MALLAEAVTQPLFPEDELNREKKRRVLDLEREKENPNQTVAKITRRIVYGADHPYSLNPSGTVATMEAIGREDVVRRHREHFTPGNAVLLAVGDVTPDEIEDVARRHLGGWDGPAPEVDATPEPPERTGRVVYLVDKPGDSQSTLSVAHLGVSRNDPAWERILVANRILGGMFTSRLNLNVREDKGYSYGTRTSFSERVHRGAFAMGGRVQTEVTAPALVEFLKELGGIHGARPITEEELAFAKGSVTQNYAGEFETNREVVGALAEQVIYGLPDDYLTSYPDRIDAVTVEEANAAGATYFHPDRVAVIVVGDVAKIEESIRALDLGPLVHLDSEGRVIEKPAAGSGTEEE
jgi:zinc protease